MAYDTTVLITGSKSGIGRGLLTAYAARPNTLAIAAIRDGPDSTPASSLTNIPVGPGSKIVVAEYDASSHTAGTDLVKYLQTTYSLGSLDVVIANAGILKHFGPASEASPATIIEHFEINTLAPILLYQATQPLLNASRQNPRFFIISSSIGSNGLQDHYPLPMIAYGTSKAAVTYAASRIHREESRITIVPVQPGWVQTEMGNKAAALAGMNAEDVPVTLDESVSGLISLFDKANKETHSGKFWDHTGTQLPW
ncbi:hypothetical protein PV08_05366 [Exophiala spinifera]|uniref:Uncharacterized protein n=1 Tax=Exophiala spinifera TaxID=91928 RepID=A0A0D1YK12_9EURO|nr:uncharacterized protein PV08_05366 [Exophiala spinifera]KIW15321.1 hypothetical protein PV08_05366 [Exophiala spinifera]